MKIVYDDDSDIALCHIYQFLTTVFKSSLRKNSDGEIILKKSGLSSLCETYKVELKPYSYNGNGKMLMFNLTPQKFFLNFTLS